MSYTPNTWASGDVISAAKMNNIEQGLVETNAQSLYERGTLISNVSINDITTPGKYYSNDTANTATITDLPSAIVAGFTLYVLCQGNATLVQVIMQNTNNANWMFFRGVGSTNWHMVNATVVS